MRREFINQSNIFFFLGGGSISFISKFPISQKSNVI